MVLPQVKVLGQGNPVSVRLYEKEALQKKALQLFLA